MPACLQLRDIPAAKKQRMHTNADGQGADAFEAQAAAFVRAFASLPLDGLGAEEALAAVAQLLEAC